MRVKICGIANGEQGRAIAQLGATALGLICVPRSPRYVPPQHLARLVEQFPPQVDRIGVFADSALSEISTLTAQNILTGVQLHGKESPEYCDRLRQMCPGIEIIKALRVRTLDSLAAEVEAYEGSADTYLLDAYHPQQLGGTGKTLDWNAIASFDFPLPWFLAGGLAPDNITDALAIVQPDGIDLSSGVERSPGDKDIQKVALLFERLLNCNNR
ncbi:MAG: phosphoribosylanthranilate isomerase [Cyanobacteriota bacterium]|nr:phosphoribosylanthranilate isomerase [Cyanobacteriota bacterium]